MAEETATQNGAPAAPPAAPPPPAAAAPVAPAATAPEPPKEQKIKVRKPRQRSCDEKDAKGKLCAGHLKRWYDYPRKLRPRSGRMRKFTAANSARRSTSLTRSKCRTASRCDIKAARAPATAQPR